MEQIQLLVQKLHNTLESIIYKYYITLCPVNGLPPHNTLDPGTYKSALIWAYIYVLFQVITGPAVKLSTLLVEANWAHLS